MAGNSKTACGCDETPRDPYQDSLEAVWHDPTSYDPVKHGPSYMPRTASVKGAGRLIAAQVIHPKVAQSMFPGRTPLSGLLAVLRAASMVHQTHHWQTHGGHYYGDHLLFERLYNESQDFIDQVAERAVGSTESDAVNIHDQVTAVALLAKTMCTGSLDPEDMVESSLKAESMVVHSVAIVLKQLEASGDLTNGTDNLLQGISDLHEGFLYLLKQRANTVSYDYGR